MPRMRVLIGTHIISPNENVPAAAWAYPRKYGEIRHPVGKILGEVDQVAIVPEYADSLEPRELLLGVEFDLLTGKYYPEERQALETALAIYNELAHPEAPWELPQKWGFWFHHKGSFDDIWLSPANIEEKQTRYHGLADLV